ncbi:MAG: EAL domain-containing protein [Burkholderiales bacterium]|nr:EAL domain-containing protein [Burkholderiales bacterium]
MLRILDGELLHPVFQPIVSLKDQGIIGYEGLIRGPSNSPLHAPLTLLQTAAHFGKLIAMERACRRATIQRFAELETDGTLFLNVSPDSLLEPEFRPGETRALLKELGLAPERIVIELTETRPMQDYALLREAADHYRKMGFRIAIDDLGEGFASLRLWSELRPDFVKIDKHFMSGIHLDPVKQQFVASILRIASAAGTRTIAEGVEVVEELRMARKLGLDFVQGYYLGRPETAPRTHLTSEVMAVLSDREGGRDQRNLLSRSSQVALQLLRENPFVRPDANTEHVYRLFAEHHELYAIPVVDEQGSPIGLIRRAELLEAFAKPYTRELYGKKRCTKLMDRQPLIVDASLSLAALSQLVVAADRRYLVDGFIITRDGRYLGVGTGHDLMRSITEIQINAARYANPLTLLPGNVPINERIDEFIDQDVPFVAVFADLNHFKPFNDVYGYRKGDDVIQLLGKLLVEAVDSERDFVGHVGGDDFVMLFQSDDWQARCQWLLHEFDDRIVNYFSTEHLAQRGYLTKDRRGQETMHPLVSLALGAVLGTHGRFLSHRDLSVALAEVKLGAKSQGGSTLFVDRRTATHALPLIGEAQTLELPMLRHENDR